MPKRKWPTCGPIHVPISLLYWFFIIEVIPRFFFDDRWYSHFSPLDWWFIWIFFVRLERHAGEPNHYTNWLPGEYVTLQTLPQLALWKFLAKNSLNLVLGLIHMYIQRRLGSKDRWLELTSFGDAPDKLLYEFTSVFFESLAQHLTP